MRTLAPSLSAIGFTVFVLAADASAQTYDHLTCFKAKDSQKFSAAVTLDALQDKYDPLGQCQIKGKAALFCVPTHKTVDSFVVNKDPATPLIVPGPELIPDRICYKMKCPKSSLSDELVSDQFGTRPLSKFKASLLCTPAVKGLPPTTTTTSTTNTTLCVPDCAGKTCGDDGCGGSCGACGSAESCCGFTCIDTQSDPTNCGGCGLNCGAATSCDAGQCRCDCSTGPGVVCGAGSCSCLCTAIFDPHCGDDGNTYGNLCELQLCDGVNLDHAGTCP